MSLEAPTYDLTLLLDLSATDEVRAKLLAECKSAIEAAGTLLGHYEWGTRTMTYEIDKREQAEYHLMQFHATPALLEQLGHRLRIADEVIRHRVIKLAPGTPSPPDARSSAASASAPAPSAEAPAGEYAEA